MTAFLLDVNVLLAISWPQHVFHKQAHEWFAAKGARPWATCPFTETAFVRLSSNPSFSPKAVTARDALTLLGYLLKLPGHQFWPDDIGYADSVQAFKESVVRSRDVTDAYLLGLAAHRKGTLATFDRAIQRLLASNGRGAKIEIIAHHR